MMAVRRTVYQSEVLPYGNVEELNQRILLLNCNANPEVGAAL